MMQKKFYPSSAKHGYCKINTLVMKSCVSRSYHSKMQNETCTAGAIGDGGGGGVFRGGFVNTLRVGHNLLQPSIIRDSAIINRSSNPLYKYTNPSSQFTEYLAPSAEVFVMWPWMSCNKTLMHIRPLQLQVQ